MKQLVVAILLASAGRTAAHPAAPPRPAGSAGPVAPAAESPEPAARARVADESARKHYALREYAAAIADYRRAFDALPDPLFLFNIAQAYRQLHDCDNARAFYAAYLRDRPEADNRATVERFIAEAQKCAREQDRDVTSVVAAPAPQARSSLRIAGAITGTAGLAVVSLGVYFSYAAARRASDLEVACAASCEGSAVASIDRAGHDAERNAIIAYTLGGTAVAAGLAIVLWETVRREAPPVVVAPTVGGATISATARF